MTPTKNIQPWDPADSPGPQINAALTAEPPRKPEIRPRRSQEDVPEHVKVLMDGLSEELTLGQREQLAAALIEYQDIFSTGKGDMGCTDAVQHQIDTGESRPIRQPPRRLPIAKTEY